MAAFDLTKIGTSVNGDILSAPLGTPLPDAVDYEFITVDNAGPWTNHGYASTDGFGSTENVTQEEQNAWQNNQLVDTSVTAATRDYSTALLEENDDNWELFSGAPRDADGNFRLAPGVYGPHRVFVFRRISSKGKATLFALEDGAVNSREDLTSNTSTVFNFGFVVRDYTVGGAHVITEEDGAGS